MSFFSKKNIRLVSTPTVEFRVVDFVRNKKGGWTVQNALSADSGIQKGCLGCVGVLAAIALVMTCFVNLKDCCGSSSRMTTSQRSSSDSRSSVSKTKSSENTSASRKTDVPKKERISVPDTYRTIADFQKIEKDRVIAWAKKNTPEEYASLSLLNEKALAADSEMRAIANRLESDPKTWGSSAFDTEFLAKKAELKNVEDEAVAIWQQILVGYKSRPQVKPYTLVRGDTPAKICAKNNVTKELLQALNPDTDLSSVLKLKVGQVVNVPTEEFCEEEYFAEGDPKTNVPVAPLSDTQLQEDTSRAVPTSNGNDSSAEDATPSPARLAVAEIPTEQNALKKAYRDEKLKYLSGNTPEFLAFLKAVVSGDMDLVAEICREYPAVVNEIYQDVYGDEKRTMLVWAARNRRASLVSILIAAGANVNVVSSIGATPLSNAVSSGNEECVSLLLAAGADVNVNASDGRTLLEKAQRNPAITGMIVNAKTSFTHEDLNVVLRGQDVDLALVKKILSGGVKPNEEIMYLAVKKNDAELLRVLLEAGGNADAEYRGTPILFSCPYRGDISCAKVLIDYGANTNFTVPISGRTSYHVYLKNRRAAELLNYIESASARSTK